MMFGTVINPMNLEGQLRRNSYGTLDNALSEEIALMRKVFPKIMNLDHIRCLRADDMPSIKIHFVDGYEKDGPYGSKSIGECAVVPSAPAVVNAVLRCYWFRRYIHCR